MNKEDSLIPSSFLPPAKLQELEEGDANKIAINWW